MFNYSILKGESTMNKRIIVLAFTLVVSMMVFQAGSAFAAQGAADKDVEALSQRDDVLKNVEPSFRFLDVKHVANGIAMRNKKAGHIHLRGIPVGSKIVKALLYWNYSDGFAVGAPTSLARFGVECAKKLIKGSKVADSADPCWGLVGNHTYRADVTAIVAIAAIPAGTPNLNFRFQTLEAGVSDTGVNPWTTLPASKLMEGATLVVVYTGPTTVGSSVFIYDALSGSMFTGVGTFNLFHPAPPSVLGLFTMSGADGQRGFGHDNVLSGETTTFNGALIAGGVAPAAAPSSDWDGSAGWPLVQLWDVHTHRVDKIAGVFENVVYTSPGDCLVPVVFVLQVGAIED